MRRLWSPCMLLLFPIGLIIGCPPRENEEAVLAGTWVLETTAPGPLGQVTLVFDNRGDLDLVSIEPAEGVTIERNNPVSSTDVNGSDVSLETNLLVLGTLRFEGSLNEDATVATGRLTTNLNLIFATIVIESGEATMTKVE